MKKLRVIRIVIQRVLITGAVFWAAIMVIQFTAITPKAVYSPCKRPCNRADWPRICRYRLVIEKISLPKFLMNHKNIISNENGAATPDGSGKLSRQVESHYFLVNGHHTGPTLEVCKNDFLVIDVENRIPGRSISLHWTGQTQKRTPFMDGVPMISQCPITSYTTFQYKFQANRVGTHLYYGFSNDERKLGLIGALLVRSVHEQSQHPLTSQCQDDLIWLISEVNGTFLINGNRSMTLSVQPKSRYRLRVAYAAPVGTWNHCQRWLEIQDHNLTVIALDGNLVEPLVVERVALSDGNRVDLIVHTNVYHRVEQDYEIRLVATGDSPRSVYTGYNSNECHLRRRDELPYAAHGSTNNFRLKYVRSETADSTLPPSGATGDSRDRFPPELREVERQISLVLTKRKVERQIFGERFYDVSYSVNGFSFIYPSVLMLQRKFNDDADLEHIICSNSSGYRRMPKKCHQTVDEACECVHVESVELGHRVELVIVNEDNDSAYTYHLHGYSFFVIASTRTTQHENWQTQLLNLGRNYDRPVLLDTVRIESNSMVVLRFVASNAGLWMLRDLDAEHEWSRGLDVLLNVRASETEINFPDDFPKCRHFVGPKYFLI
ncbi:AAEL006583-PA [Aedes aegypti]|uniref:AAEL006583-PA n=1 Tax=Aedes aegypti TaxID=7159 RepID=Q175R6_AEDAE|nr:AAEL006583-PA [Aedes aegypti]